MRSISRRSRTERRDQGQEGALKKTINNHLTVLCRLLAIAKKRGLVDGVPEIDWLKAPKPAFDFLDFGEAQRLIEAGDEDWRTMIPLATRRGFGRGSYSRSGGGRTSISWRVRS